MRRFPKSVREVFGAEDFTTEDYLWCGWMLVAIGISCALGVIFATL